MRLSLCALFVFCASFLHAEADLKGKPPEDFDWFEYVNEGDSASGEMFRAEEGVKILELRMNELCTAYLELLASRKEEEGVRLFNEMQAHWKKASDAEVSLIGGSWRGGSGARVAYPKARLHSYLFRIKELKDIANQCLSLNR
ncbi:MAG: hypothetical protein ABIP44_08145 [Pseudoxanthomonas sp.]